MTTPKIILILWYTYSLWIAYVKDGKPRDNYSFKSTAICYAIIMLLLLASDFF